MVLPSLADIVNWCPWICMGWASCTTASDNLQDKTQENALVLFLKGEERIRVGQQAVIAIIVSLFQQALATVAIC